MFKLPHIRWFIAGLLLLAAVKNYIDRMALGLLAPTLQADLHITDAQYAFVNNCFLAAYTIAYILSGRLADWLGTRRAMALFVVGWSAASALTALTRPLAAQGWFGTLAQAFTAASPLLVALALFRFLLGLGEAGGWTASPKAVSEWFPARERGLAIGIYSMGGPLGALIASWLVLELNRRFHWEGVFLVIGLLGFVWVIPWLWLYRRPAEHPLLTERERALLAETMAETGAVRDTPRVPEWQLWAEVVRQPAVWLLMLARLLTDPVWYFMQFWMPKYLHSERGLSQQQLSTMWLIFLAADVGFFLGGYLSGRLVRRGVAAPASRLWLMLGCACLTPLLPLAGLAPTLPLSLACGMAVSLAATAFLGNLSALVVDIIPKRILGTSFGLIAGGSALGGMLMNWLVGRTINHYSYMPCFYAMMLVHPLAVALVWRLRKQRTNGEG